MAFVVAFASFVQWRLAIFIAQIGIGSVAQKNFGDGWPAKASSLNSIKKKQMMVSRRKS